MLIVLFGIGALTFLGCGPGNEELTADDRLRLQDACKGREHVPPGEADGPTDTVPGSVGQVTATTRPIACST
jgi:hypothetical protein